eukprot:TRINITY_DN9698_c0_g1_i3.p2 TRINITY_DN9698_c0_g1~~TRINITY_DN9698_c0_g1_i3.p2  ORF type:complete len:126 (-),score=15.85 TRINITY_DN9698_c0_g1_i3:124-501(-)
MLLFIGFSRVNHLLFRSQTCNFTIELFKYREESLRLKTLFADVLSEARRPKRPASLDSTGYLTADDDEIESLLNFPAPRVKRKAPAKPAKFDLYDFIEECKNESMEPNEIESQIRRLFRKKNKDL